MDILSSYTHNRAVQCYTKGRRDKNLRKYVEAISALQDGTKITYKRIAEKLGISERHLRRIRDNEEYLEFFEKQQIVIENYNAELKKRKQN